MGSMALADRRSSNRIEVTLVILVLLPPMVTNRLYEKTSTITANSRLPYGIYCANAVDPAEWSQSCVEILKDL